MVSALNLLLFVSRMNFPVCPAWDYEHYPNKSTILQQRTSELLVHLRSGSIDIIANLIDTREVHKFLFSELVPPNHRYFAGHYRGESFLCLKSCFVGVPNDNRVGFHPAIVQDKMQQFSELILLGMNALDRMHSFPEQLVPSEDKLLSTVAFACQVFEEFLRVHPYANGNGHIGRFLIWAILVKYRYFPVQFPIDPRPFFLDYAKVITEYRDGNHEPLESYILSCIAFDRE